MSSAVVYFGLVFVTLATILNGVTGEEGNKKSLCETSPELVESYQKCIKESKEKQEPGTPINITALVVCSAVEMKFLEDGVYQNDAVCAFIKKSQANNEYAKEELLKRADDCNDTEGASDVEKLMCFLKSVQEVCTPKNPPAAA